jgi:exodeoxyribonuclease V alpha subunit
LGTVMLNEELQALLNPLGPGRFDFKTAGGVFRVGDKVIQCVNSYDLGVFNGDIGFVEHAAVDGGKIIVSMGDREVTYSQDQAKDLRHAYAITIHKAQGSEFPAVIIPLSLAHYIMLQRNLIYTALTRAKKLAIFVGSARALNAAIRSQSSVARQSRLVERLRQHTN